MTIKKFFIFMNIGVSKSLIKGYAEKMKHTFLVIFIAVCICALSGCNGKGKGGGSFPEETISKDASYALGMDVGSNLKVQNFFPNEEEFLRGMRDTLTDVEPRLTFEEAYQILNEAFTAMAEKRDMESRQAENEFLAENSKKDGINITSSGLQYEVIQEGSGPKPTATDVVRVHYEGSLVDGTVFDSSYSRGEPTEFSLAAVIPGWAEGLQLMNTGSAYRLYIPSDLGYRSQGAGPQIPPYSTLIFEVELLGIVQ
jgi:FKBP-type peptidyl-prolyl cis-trans isomerase